jgi:FKBP-type peptidyl-prolyl cis-trans isomerase
MKRKSYILGVLLTGFLVSCDPSGDTEADPIVEDTNEPKEVTSIKTTDIDVVKEVIDEKKIKKGIKIKWFERGEGEKIKAGEVVHVDYKVSLKTGDVIDGNHLLSKPYIPFMVGFGVQHEGWDLALQELKVGDFAEIYLPAKTVRGDKEIEGLIPKNSDNILKIRVIERVKPDREVDGNKVWIFEENPNNEKLFSETSEIDFHCMAFTVTSPLFVNTYRTNNPISMKLEDHGIVPGLKKALINAKKGDRMLVYVPSSEAYHTKGFQDLVKPNEDVMYNVLVMDVRDL